MRMLVLVSSLLLLGSPPLSADEPGQSDKRFGQNIDLKKYPQDTPQHALASFVKAVRDKDIEYAVAQLADPGFVDRRLKDTGGKFSDLIAAARKKLVDDPAALKLLERLAKDGRWTVNEDHASLALMDLPDKQVLLVKRKERWFIENRFRPAKPKEIDPDG